MFKALEEINNSIEEKKIIEYIEDIYKHLMIYYPTHKKINSDTKTILVELGLILNEESFNEFMHFIEKKLKINSSEFTKYLSIIDHNSNNKCVIPKICKLCRNNSVKQEMKAVKPTVVDLFCGSGGMSLGFSQAGFKILFANDIEPSCTETYCYNHPEIDKNKVVLGDIQDIALTVSDYTFGENVDVVIGGPPCQGFSNANRQRVIDDPRNRLYKEFVNVVSTVRPQFFVMENVVGMKSIANQIVEDFNNIGFEVSFKILNAIDFGVPQHRKRIIFIGNRNGINNDKIFEQIASNNNFPNTTLANAIQDLPPLEALKIKNATNYESEENGFIIQANNNKHTNEYLSMINNGVISKVIYNHKARYNNERDIEIFSRLNQGDKSDDPKIADIMPYKNRNDIFKDKYYKLVYNQPSKTITAHMKFDCNMYIHPTQARGLTPREAARIQSYPDDYFFKGSFTKTYMQIGNSVPPLMARAIAKEVIKYIGKEQETEIKKQLVLPLDFNS
ncbi:hypothetical protein UACE39S_00994 [Ureibacillus acetophenoni]